MIKAAVLTISDKGSRGEREDLSGPAVMEMLKNAGAEIINYEIIPDEAEVISARIIRLSDKSRAGLIITTGGTGV